MIILALKMLIGNRASFLGVIFGLFLATLLISQQSAIFLGLIARSYRTLTDIPAPNVWVIDPATESDDKVRGIPAGYLDVVRSVPGVEWATAIQLTNLPLITPTGIFQMGQFYGVDDATLIGAPTQMVEGQASDLRREGGIIVDIYSARGILAKTGTDGTKVALKLGDELEVNGHRAVVVGLCRITQGFYPQPIIFTSHSAFQLFTSYANDQVAFIATKTKPTATVAEVCHQIEVRSGLSALTRDQFQDKIVQSFLATGILINFGLSVGLGMVIGFSIAGQTFYLLTLENLMYYALIKAVGGTKKIILQMITVQALLSGLVGFSLGLAVNMLWGKAVEDTTLAFLFPWQLLLFTALVILTICLATAAFSIRKVFRIDPKVLLGN